MEENPFAQFAYTGPVRTRLQPVPQSTPLPPRLPEFDTDTVSHILSFAIANDAWATLYIAMRVGHTWGCAVYRSVMRHFEFEQDQTVAFVKAVFLGRNVFLTGGPGTGKSYVTDCITKVLRKLKIQTAVVAPTGIAANNVNGCTTTRFIGARRVMIPKQKGPKLRLEILNEDILNSDEPAGEINDSDNSDDDIVDNVDNVDTKTASFMPIRNKAPFDNKLRVLIIDEVSMLSDFKFQQLELVVTDVLGRTNPFARGRVVDGVQLILVGDFAQLPAIVPTGTPEDIAIKYGQFERFLFKSKRWSALDLHMIELTVCKRSRHVEYAQLAYKLRHNLPVDVAAWSAITRTEDANENLGIFGNWAARGKTFEEINRFPCAWNFNKQRLDSLPGHWIPLNAIDVEVANIPVPKRSPVIIWIKEGCRIQLRNTAFNGVRLGLANNMCGTVHSFTGGDTLETRFFTSNDSFFTYDITRHTTKSKARGPNGTRSSRRQFSIRVAHGITAHGAQGQTIHEPFIVQCDQCWDSGHLLVMLSRASDPGLMRLVNLDRARPFIAEAVLTFHRRIRTAMQRAGRPWYAA